MTSLVQRDAAKIPEERRRIEREIRDLGVGGYCVFGGDVDSTRELVRDLAGLAQHRLLVASDLERGLGQQLLGGTTFPCSMAVGATARPDLAFATGFATGREARDVGIDVVFAPVADVQSEPRNPIVGSRAYGSDPTTVASFVSSFVTGCQLGGAAATAKHFPGHGDTGEDSHIDLPLVRATRDVLARRELVPFRAAVGAGVRAVMTAHVAYPSLTGDDVPATLSPSIVRRLLRERLGFRGVIVTDALVMGAVVRAYGARDAAVAAVRAGADILLMPGDVAGAIDGVAAAVRDGVVSEARIDESLARIDELASWLSATQPAAPPEGSVGAGVASMLAAPPSSRGRTGRERWAGHEALAATIAREAATLMRDGGALPLSARGLEAGSVDFVALIDAGRPPDVAPFRAELAARVPGAVLSVVGEDAAPSDVARLLEHASRKECLVIAIFDELAAWRGRAGPSDALVLVATRLSASCERTVVIAFGTPLIAALVPGARSVLCCYDTTPASQAAGVGALFGEFTPSGRLPVALGPEPIRRLEG
jgi:beta-N-acetylhexosaminidase